MGDEEAELSPRGRGPGADARIGSGLVEVDRRAASALMEARVGRRPFLMRAPAEFRRLHALRQKAFDRPGVDEHVARLRRLRALRVAFGDMHALDAEAMGEAAPFVFRLRRRGFVAKIGGEIDERLLDEPGDHAGIGPATGDGGRSAWVPAAFTHHGLAQCVIGARFVAKRLVVIESRPGLDNRVDVERADLAAIAHDVERGGVDREVDAEALAFAGGQVFAQHVAIIIAREPQLHEADATLIEEPPICIVRIDDDEAALSKSK